MAQPTMPAVIGGLKAAFLCILYMTVGPALIVTNKTIMRELGFPFPMLLSALGVTCSALVARILVATGVATVRQEKREFVAGANWYRRVLPVGMLHAATLACGNAVYLHLGVSFVQMLKAFTPVVVLATMVALRLESPRKEVLAAVSFIVLGTLVTTAAAPELRPIGILFMAGAEVAEALRLALTQFLLTAQKFTVLEGQYILSPAGSVCLLAAAAVIEAPRALETGAFDVVLQEPAAFCAAALLGVGVNYLSYFVIGAVGALTLKVLGTLRNIGLVAYGAVVLGEVVTGRQCLGYALSLGGFVGYNHYRTKVPSRAVEAKKTADAEAELREPLKDAEEGRA
mmetsp:Transcript_43593/g.136781  ORF Transcript_43593/g.136781 Transcript_43593/m.136781 type:complete len:342 (-) Transcript_43593:73-1098(-)|eukprot:CAMPEP_0118853950 /NCGR_PEP_ID=MMETSP1163-20130328/2343_1 /TAXON_ID=124430 /ORGANISM="Phaeomonas parva, Strain CCMP2877" /LENGTH=341 /DNA_ID=CAMNT_0006786581 /DNA_START=280 /DNA_END=1305 /DNA_ORIENTATION=+